MGKGSAKPLFNRYTNANDLTNQYNTELSPLDSILFKLYAQNYMNPLGRDLQGDKWDYDIQGAYKDGAISPNGLMHLGDLYKKPNHPTFSDESKYNGMNGNVGGRWVGNDYMPSPLQQSTEDRFNFLRGYFRNNEPNSKLLTSKK